MTDSGWKTFLEQQNTQIVSWWCFSLTFYFCCVFTYTNSINIYKYKYFLCLLVFEWCDCCRNFSYETHIYVIYTRYITFHSSSSLSFYFLILSSQSFSRFFFLLSMILINFLYVRPMPWCYIWFNINLLKGRFCYLFEQMKLKLCVFFSIWQTDNSMKWTALIWLNQSNR